MATKMTLAEVVMTYGPIVAADEDMGLVVTVSGSYVQLWRQDKAGLFEAIDLQSNDRDLYHITAAEAIDLGEAFLAECLEESED